MTFADSCVILELGRHACELLLKGAISAKSPQAEIFGAHALEPLKAKYDSLYPSVPFDLPYGQQESEPDLSGADRAREAAERLDALGKLPPHMIYRYPVDRQGQTWRMVAGFNVVAFLEAVLGMRAVTAAIRTELAAASSDR